MFVFDLDNFLHNNKSRILVSTALSIYTACFSLPIESPLSPLSCWREVKPQDSTYATDSGLSGTPSTTARPSVWVGSRGLMVAHRVEFCTDPSIHTYGGSTPTYPTAPSPRKLNLFACCRGSGRNTRSSALIIIPRNQGRSNI